MSVYVDTPLRYSHEPDGYVGRTRAVILWGHMIADSEVELLTMARAIGLREKWLQRDHHGVHFDLVPSKRALAIKLGAKPVAWREFIAMLRLIRARSLLACV